MNTDYLLVAVDQEQRFVLRLLNLEHQFQSDLIIPNLSENLKKIYADYLIGSVLLGSRFDDQEVSLFKIIFEDGLRINVEVSPKGIFRSSVFPRERRKDFDEIIKGKLNVARLKKNKDVYDSIVEFDTGEISEVLKIYLQQSNQTDSILLIHSDLEEVKNNFGLWIERLPNTDEEAWVSLINHFNSTNLFKEVINQTNDPDQIMKEIFPYPFKILAVTKPKFECGCSKEKVIDALKLLSNEELVDIFMEGKGVSTRCDYCDQIWEITDLEIKNILNVSNQKH